MTNNNANTDKGAKQVSAFTPPFDFRFHDLKKRVIIGLNCILCLEEAPEWTTCVMAAFLVPNGQKGGCGGLLLYGGDWPK